ncbi:MAG: hypothetical protein JXA60_06475 [Candidatus Coatesbacteria bacterium]|nr:hypothetical protein [Candidatus Coatesbacteria bacterium]
MSLSFKKGEIAAERIFTLTMGEADEHRMEMACIYLEDSGLYSVFRLKTKIYVIWNDEETTPIHPAFFVNGKYATDPPNLSWYENKPGERIIIKNYKVILK